MTLVNVNCTDQTLTVTSRPQIASGGVNEDRMEFSFCAKWDGYAKTAVFYRTEDDVYHVLLDDNDTCVIPKEVLLEPGILRFGVFGVKGDSTRTSAVQVYSVAEGAITEATAVPDPTPDIYAQLLGAMGDLSKLETTDRSSLVAAINELKRTGGGSGGGETGTTDHAKLLNRDAADQHPISAVSGLQDALDDKQPKGSYLTEETDPTVPDWAKQPEKPTYTAEEVHALPDTYTPPVDTTLTQSGQAADAAKVGQELSSLSGKMVKSVNNQKPDENGNVTIEAGSGGGDIALGITGATVGQIAKITAVDDTGKPTAWEPVDMEGGWELITDVTLTEDGGGAFTGAITKNDNGEEFEYRQCMVCLSGTVIDDWPSGAYSRISLYGNNAASGENATVSLSRLGYGAGGTTYKSTIEVSLFGGLFRVIACGGQADTSSLIIRDDAPIETFKSIKLTSYGNSQWCVVPYAAGGRIVIYGRK